MNNFLFVLLLALVGCGEHETVKATAYEKPKHSFEASLQIPDGAIDLAQGRYLRLIEKEGMIYAGVVIPQGSAPTERVELLHPGERRRWASTQLAKHSPNRWIDAGVEQKDGYTVFKFRQPTPEEEKEARDVSEEMRKSLIPQ